MDEEYNKENYRCAFCGSKNVWVNGPMTCALDQCNDCGGHELKYIKPGQTAIPSWEELLRAVARCVDCGSKDVVVYPKRSNIFEVKKHNHCTTCYSTNISYVTIT